MKSREKLARILEALRDRIASPSDVIASTGLPRYEVLASFHILEALGIVKVVYARGNYKLYKLTEAGYRLLDVLSRGTEFTIKIEPLEVEETSTTSDSEALNVVTDTAIAEVTA
ncbi:MAG TPA: transcriptional regulator [Ignisphaera sp.]|uniref:Transcriptional regulator n=1 Tax=Ignisphaera aggregans TaxID=334771 RepID=A0A832YTR4_9CREN|nr:transcriptional regulator [Ignisphaera sp.]HIP57615.1 transcriptional regulator [Ignisphaera aggregans]